MGGFRVQFIGVFTAAMAVIGCDQVGLAPKAARSAPVQAAAPAPMPDFRTAVGQDYRAFAARPEMAAYTAPGFGLSDSDRARFESAMAVSAGPSWIATGGGAEALVFAGCADTGCDVGRAVLAIDVATGAAFVGAVDAQGTETLVPNPRVEALLRLSSPSRAWEDLPRSPGGDAPERP
jgi:hypothetical protein